MVNILYIHQSAEMYGSDKTLFYLVTKLDKSKYNPIVVLPNEGPLKEALLKENIKVIIAPVIKLHRKMFMIKYLSTLPLSIKKSIQFIKNETKDIRIDIVQSNTLAVLLGVFISRKLKAKHIWHVHEIITHPKFISNLYPKILYRYADKVICNSNATLENLLHRNQKLKHKLQLIYNGLDCNEFSHAIALSNRESLNYTSEDIIITLIGRISRLKGHLFLLKVINDYFKDNKNIKILFTGSPVLGQEFYLTAIQEKIKEYQLEQRVKILPFQEDLSNIRAISDIIIVPSTEAESFGLVALEAMLTSKPVIATNLGGLKEIVVHNETGFLFENKNELDLKDALSKLIDDKDLRISFGKKGYQRALDLFSLHKYVEDFEKLYE